MPEAERSCQLDAVGAVSPRWNMARAPSLSEVDRGWDDPQAATPNPLCFAMPVAPGPAAAMLARGVAPALYVDADATVRVSPLPLPRRSKAMPAVRPRFAATPRRIAIGLLGAVIGIAIGFALMRDPKLPLLGMHRTAPVATSQSAAVGETRKKTKKVGTQRIARPGKAATAKVKRVASTKTAPTTKKSKKPAAKTKKVAAAR